MVHSKRSGVLDQLENQLKAKCIHGKNKFKYRGTANVKISYVMQILKLIVSRVWDGQDWDCRLRGKRKEIPQTELDPARRD
jgi:hypothetical protein